MAIRLTHNYSNFDQLKERNFCAKHNVQVNTHYACDSFKMKASLKDERNCVTFSLYEKSDCANPEKSALGMLCAAWAPQAQA